MNRITQLNIKTPPTIIRKNRRAYLRMDRKSSNLMQPISTETMIENRMRTNK